MESPFVVLGLAPTLDLARVKRAWFAALKLHPPHKDAGAFRRIRDAYEALEAPGGLESAYARAPIDLDQELRALGERLDAPLAAALAEVRRGVQVERRRRRFVETYSRLSLAEAVARSRP